MQQDRSNLLTERRLADSMHLDRMSAQEIVDLMHRQDVLAVEAVASQRQAIAAAVELIVQALEKGGRLLYVGAGTSGRLGVLDASECPPTFRTDPSRVQGIIAGGREAMFRSREGAEDDPRAGAAAMSRKRVGPNDAIVGITAGGTTPFVHGALRRAGALGAATIFLSCVQPVPDEPPVDVVIRPLTGPEVVTGSTRLKAGTATKLILNTLSTAAMVRLGKVYENLMVDLAATNDKLRDRAVRIIMTLADLDRTEAEALLRRADGQVKTAMLMHRSGLTVEAARARLEDCGGRLEKALRDIVPRPA